MNKYKCVCHDEKECRAKINANGIKDDGTKIYIKKKFQNFFKKELQASHI